MNTTDQFIAGLRIANRLKNTTCNKACKEAGVNPSTLYRFMNRESDMQLNTLDAICRKGYQMSISKIIALGEA